MLRATVLRATRPLRQTPALTRLYHQKVIDHYERPRNVGSLPKNDIDVGTGLYSIPPDLPPDRPPFLVLEKMLIQRIELEHLPVVM